MVQCLVGEHSTQCRNFIHAQMMKRGLLALRTPTFQDSQINGPYRALRHAKLLGHPPRRTALASLAHGLFKAFGERRLARQLVHFFRSSSRSLDSAPGLEDRYPGQPRILLQSFCFNPPVFRNHRLHETHAHACRARFLRRA